MPPAGLLLSTVCHVAHMCCNELQTNSKSFCSPADMALLLVPSACQNHIDVHRNIHIHIHRHIHIHIQMPVHIHSHSHTHVKMHKNIHRHVHIQGKGKGEGKGKGIDMDIYTGCRFCTVSMSMYSKGRVDTEQCYQPLDKCMSCYIDYIYSCGCVCSFC